MSSIKISILFVVFGITLFVVQFFVQHRNFEPNARMPEPFDINFYKPAGGVSHFPLAINCNNSQTGYLEFTGRVLAHNQFSNLKSLNKNPEKLVRSQLKFVDGFTDHSDHTNIRFVPFYDKQLEILEVRKAKYPVDIFLDKVNVDSAYYPQGFLNKWYRKGDDSLEIIYKAHVKVARCLPVSKKKSLDIRNFSVTLPLDPYLAYWYIPKNKRVNKVFSSSDKQMKTNPCAASIMALYGLPNMYWSAWMPLAKTEQYDCSELLDDRSHKMTSTAKFIPIKKNRQKVTFSSLKDKKEINISLISGLLLPLETQPNLVNARKLIPYIDSIDKIPRHILKGQDYSTLATFTVMHLMKKLAKETQWQSKDFEDHIIFKTKGKLINSGKDFTFKIYLGPTVSYQKGQKHWEFLAESLKTSDFIFYSGHAGMGTAFTVKELQKNSSFKDFKHSPQNQFLALLSCSSVSYFGDDFLQARKKLGKVTDLLLTGFDEHSYRLTPAVIQYVDLELSGMKYSIEEILSPYLSTGHDIHLTRD